MGLFARKGASKLPENVLFLILIPFLGTIAGAGLVFVIKGSMNPSIQGCMSGFAAGVMTAASVWGLIIPAIERSPELGVAAILPVVIGIWIGFLFLLAADRLLHMQRLQQSRLIRKIQVSPAHTMTILAICLHNIPEGMAVGAIIAGWLTAGQAISSVSVLALSIGIAVQNIPEGAIVSIPLRADGMRGGKAFMIGVISALLESAGTIITILMAGYIFAALPLLLCFAAGAMLYVVIRELIPEMTASKRANIGTVLFFIGFTLMMILDSTFG